MQELDASQPRPLGVADVGRAERISPRRLGQNRTGEERVDVDPHTLAQHQVVKQLLRPLDHRLTLGIEDQLALLADRAGNHHRQPLGPDCAGHAYPRFGQPAARVWTHGNVGCASCVAGRIRNCRNQRPPPKRPPPTESTNGRYWNP